MAEKCSFEEQQLQQCLCLLEVPEFGQKHGVDLNRTSFRKPNAKGLELVLYRMYAILHGEDKATKEFRNIWPAMDRNQQKEFNQRISDWFKELKERYQLDSLSSMTASQLKSASGHRVVNCLLELASVALHRQFARLDPQAAANFSFRVPAEKDTKLLASVEHVVRDLAAVSMQQQVQQFLRLSKESAVLQRELQTGADDLRDQYYAAKAAQQRATTALQTHQVAVSEYGGDIWGSLLDSLAAGTPTEQTTLPSLLPGSGHAAACLPTVAAEQLPLIEQLDKHLEQYQQVEQLLNSTIGSEVHPYAVDGGVLRMLMAQPHQQPNADTNPGAATQHTQQAQEAGSRSTSTGAYAQPVDVIDVLAAWVAGLEATSVVTTQLLSNGGTPAQDMGGMTWEAAGQRRGEGVGMGSGTSGVHPLLAPALDPTGHAALLATQLRAHQASGSSLQDTVAQLKVKLLVADTQLESLQPELQQALQRLQASNASCPPSPATSLTASLGSHSGTWSRSSRHSLQHHVSSSGAAPTMVAAVARAGQIGGLSTSLGSQQALATQPRESALYERRVSTSSQLSASSVDAGGMGTQASSGLAASSSSKPGSEQMRGARSGSSGGLRAGVATQGTMSKLHEQLQQEELVEHAKQHMPLPQSSESTAKAMDSSNSRIPATAAVRADGMQHRPSSSAAAGIGSGVTAIAGGSTAAAATAAAAGSSPRFDVEMLSPSHPSAGLLSLDDPMLDDDELLLSHLRMSH